MVSVIGKEMVPYNAGLHNDNSQSSSSSIVIESSPQTDEDLNAVARLSDFNNSSDSDLSSANEVIQIVNKPRKLALLPSTGDVIASVDGIGEVDPNCVREVLEDHNTYPPQYVFGHPENIPATREKLNYFLKVLQIKIGKYRQLASCNIPSSLKNIPLALSYETFIKLYWPGGMSCCNKIFNSSQKYIDHFYQKHLPHFKLPTLSINVSGATAAAPKYGLNENEILSNAPSTSSSTSQNVINESDSDIISLDESNDKTYASSLTQSSINFRQEIVSRLGSSNSNQSLAVRKRKTLSPTSRPGPLSHKQAQFNHTIANVDSSIESGDEKGAKRQKRARKRYSSNDSFEKINDELERDQMKYEPQHSPGAPENYVATAERLKYFEEVLVLKMRKYGSMNAHLQTPSSKDIPLALSLSGFIQYYWPGKILCCGLMRENCQVLEKHISRSHRPPKPEPKMSVVMSQVDKNAINDEAAETDTHQTKITNFLLGPKGSKNDQAERSTSKSPPGFQADQHKYPPQHKPGEREDFLANQESIDYFLEILIIKREKYAQMAPIKEKPLSSNWRDFVLHYWPGMMDCCGHVFASCKEFQSHFTNSHLPPKKIPCLKVVDASSIPSSEHTSQNEIATEAFSNTVSLNVPPGSPRSIQSSRNQRQFGRHSIEPAPSGNETSSQSLSLLSTPSHLLMINSVFDEARHLKSQIGQVITMKALLPLLERLLELVGSIAHRIRGTMEMEAISQATECLDYAWNASKIAIIRWEDLIGRSTQDRNLIAVQFAYGTLPVFTSWEQKNHLGMLENIVLLSLNTVKNWQPAPSSPEAKMASRLQTSTRRRPSIPPRMADVTISTNSKTTEDKLVIPGTSTAPVASAANASVGTAKDDKKKTSSAVSEFCRLVNISTWQNTKARSSSGYKDDNGEYNAMYRYGIGKAINLYCPLDVTHLKCCGKVFTLADLKTHVTQKHESNGQSNRTEPSISPA